MQIKVCVGGWFINTISNWLEAWGYRYIEIPSLMPYDTYKTCVDGTNNQMWELTEKIVLAPEVTNYIRSLGKNRLGTNQIYYVARCFRKETPAAMRFREFTQVGVELLGNNSLDCRQVVRKDAIRLFKILLPAYPTERYGSSLESCWRLDDNVERGLNLYDQTGKTFEISSIQLGRQLLGGGPYDGGAGWALGLERVMSEMESLNEVTRIC